MEGRVGTITVSGEKYTSERFILKSLRIDDSKVLNLTDLERKLLSFNRWNQKVALTTTLTPGKDKAGTTDIDIKVNESVPFEGHLSFDNYATESSGSIRFSLNLLMNSLTKNRDPLTLGAYVNFNSKSFHTDYNFPVFVTSSAIEARLGIRGSYSNSEVENGAFLIKSESVSGSAYMGVLLSRTPKRNISSILSATYSATTTGIDEIKNPTEAIINGRLGVSASFIMDSLQLSATAGASIGSQLSGRNNVELYGKFDASLSVRFSPAEVFFMSLNASGQWMPFNNIIPNQEMMFAGGASSVRGYSEGVLWGKSGYMVSAEAHLRLPDSKRSTLFVFADHAGIFPYPSDVRENFLLSAGAGMDLHFGDMIHFKVNLGVPLLSIDQVGDMSDFKCNFLLALDF